MNRTLVIGAVVVLLLCLLASTIANGVLLVGVVRSGGQVQEARAQSTQLAGQLATQQADSDRLRAQNQSQQQQLQQARPAPTDAATSTPPAEATPVATEALISPATSGPNTAIMDRIEQDVVSLRGLEPKSTVTRTLITEAQLRDHLGQEFEKDYTPEDARKEAITLAGFDFLPDPNVDLRKLYLDLYSEEVAGFYDPKVKQLYVISDKGDLTPWEQSVFAHEYDHALQDQTFDLEKLGLNSQNDSERSLATSALAEGDAVLLQRDFIVNKLTPDQIQQLQQELNQQPSTNLNSAPRIIRAMLEFPYTDGLNFVQDAYDRGGWAAVDAVWHNPPTSTEQILHPDQYRAGDQPQIVSLPPLTDTLGSGWQLADQDTLGEFVTRQYLENHLPVSQAESAAAGWGGDRYAVYDANQGKQTVLVLLTKWDTSSDASKFVDAYNTYASQRSQAQPQKASTNTTCWTGKDRLCLSWTSSQTLIILGPDQATVDKVSAKFSDFR